MTDKSGLTIDLTAEPHQRTDGYVYRPHDTEPSGEDIRLVSDIAVGLREGFGPDSASIKSMHFGFKRDQTPGELILTYRITVQTASMSDTVVVEGSWIYFSSWNTAELRNVDRIVGEINDKLSHAIQDRANQQEEAAKELLKLHDHTGKPRYGDLY